MLMSNGFYFVYFINGVTNYFVRILQAVQNAKIGIPKPRAPAYSQGLVFYRIRNPVTELILILIHRIVQEIKKPSLSNSEID